MKVKNGILLTLLIVLALSNIGLADVVTWDKGGSDNKWSTAENWNNDTVPTSEDEILISVITNGGINIDIPIVVKGIEINDRLYGNNEIYASSTIDTGYLKIKSGTLKTAENAFGDINISGNLEIDGNGELVCRYKNKIGNGEGQIVTVGGDAIINSKITADGKGFHFNEGPGKGGEGYGASYGSRGYKSLTMPYGSMQNPVVLGSSGNYSRGGGAIILKISGSIHINGKVTSSGTDSSTCGSSSTGGSINITALSISGSGKIYANGDGYGSGGRIALNISGTDTFNGEIAADGGNSGISGGERGRTGTIWLSQSKRNNLILGGADNIKKLKLGSDDTNDYNFGHITILDGGLLQIDGNNSRGIGGGAAIMNIAGDIKVESGGEINADYLGFRPEEGPGVGDENIGSTYGGRGYNNTDETYGDAINPICLGSGEAGIFANSGGGGAIIIKANGDATIDGVISAQGECGGSINIQAENLFGTGDIRAMGQGMNGGGRISFHIDNEDTFSGNIRVYGGAGVNYSKHGRAGTIWLSQAKRDNLILGGTGNMQKLRLGTDDEINYTFGHVEILDKGILEIDCHEVRGTSATLSISGDLTVRQGGSISADNLGYHAYEGPGKGNGGTYAGQVYLNPPATYGDFANPTALGSGGYSAPGAGAVIIKVTGSVRIDGDVTANVSSSYVSCGSGGSVNITAANLYGSGAIMACGDNYGGGGRIAINVSGEDIFSGTIAANGGDDIDNYYRGRTGTIWLSQSQRENLILGGIGHMKKLRLGSDDSCNYTFENITILDGGVLEIDGNMKRSEFGSAAKINLTGDLHIASGGEINANYLGARYEEHISTSYGGQGANSLSPTYGDMENPISLGGGCYNGNGGGAIIIAASGSVNIDGEINAAGYHWLYNGGTGGTINISALTLSGNGTIRSIGDTNCSGGRIAFHISGADTFSGLIDAGGARTGTIWLSKAKRDNLILGGQGNMLKLRLGTDDHNNYTFENIVIQDGGLLEIDGNTNRATAATINVTGELKIQSGGRLSADSLGNYSRKGPGKSNSNSGASYGGKGYMSKGITYGDLKDPINMGSGASKTSGGVVKIVADNRVLVDGLISANGGTGGEGGSGGSVNITSSVIEGGGIIQANGTGYSGGGRIAIKVAGNNNFGNISFEAYPDEYFNKSGAAGTIYLRGKDHSKLIIDQNYLTTSEYTDLSEQNAASVTVCELLLTNSASFSIGADDQLAISEYLYSTGENIPSRNRLKSISGSIINAQSAKLKIENSILVLDTNIELADKIEILPGACLDLNGYNLKCSTPTRIDNEGLIKIKGNEVLSNITNDIDSGGVEYYGTEIYSRLCLGEDYYHFHINGTGSFTNPKAIDINGDFLMDSGDFIVPQQMNVAGDFYHSSGNFDHNNSLVIFDGDDQTLSGNTIFYNFTKETEKAETLYFEKDSTQIINGKIILKGMANEPLALRVQSNSSWDKWKIDPQGPREIMYVDVKQSDNVNAEKIYAEKSIDSGMNIGWVFSETTSTSTPTLSKTVTATVSPTATPTVTIMSTFNCTPTSTSSPTKLSTSTPATTPSPTQTLTPTVTASVETINTFNRSVLAYPNPARDKVNFALRETGVDKVIINIYNLTGERIANLDQSNPGQLITWETMDIAPGIYLYQTVITQKGQEKRLKIKKVAIIH
ncbi:hypothetical protein KAR34_08410 [bacterium]|nr:hypothetical protein [bacterium]